ncbi:MAG: ComEA family DNA-binding protein [Firmicutes bacterium]|nr:ComEA family DNA-binding protein [Bacillota bacterium]
MKQRLPLVVCCSLLLLSLTANVWLLRENRQLLSSWQPMEQTELRVHVTGAVLRPGVYTLAKGARVDDALDMAGGVLPDALIQGLNLAKPLFDGEQIHVAQAAPSSSDSTSADIPATTLININTATAAELETLPGIGPVKAQAIVEYRQQNGAFARIEDLTKVSGIGPKTFERLKHLITV